MDLTHLDEVSAAPKGKKGFQKKEPAVSEAVLSDLDTFEIDPDKDYMFELYQRHTPVNQYRPPYPRSYQVVDVSLMHDHVAKRNRKVRYLPSSESIFLDEQIKENFPDGIETEPIVFMDGKLTVRGIERNKLLFLLMSDQCNKKTKRLSRKDPIFQLVDFDAIKKKNFQVLKDARVAQTHAWDCSDEEMYPAAFALGISIKQDIDFVRSEFVKVATDNPAYFNKMVNSPRNTVKYNINKGIEEDVISLTKNPGTLVWSESESAIIGLPANVVPLEYLTDFAMSQKEGKDFYKQLETILA